MADTLLLNFARLRCIQASLRKTFVSFALGSKATPAVSGTDDRSQPKANIGWPSSLQSAIDVRMTCQLWAGERPSRQDPTNVGVAGRSGHQGYKKKLDFCASLART